MEYHNINELLLRDLKWRAIAFRITKDEIQSDEIVSIFYEKMLKKFPEKICNSYVRKSLKNIWLHQLRLHRLDNPLLTDNPLNSNTVLDKNRNNNSLNFYLVEMEIEDTSTDYNHKKDIATDELYNNIMSDIGKLPYFHKEIFKYVMLNGMSIRQLAKETGIGYNTIQSIMSNINGYLKEKYNKEYANTKKEPE